MEGFKELLSACVQPFNVPFTFLLVVTLLYWVSVIVGIADVEALDLDVDADLDADVDVDADAGGESSGTLVTAFRFMNAGEVPVAITLSLLFISMWVIAILGNHYLNPRSSALLAAAYAIPNIVSSVFVAKYLGWPFRWVFRQLDKGTEQREEMIGKVCRVVTSQVSNATGQADIATDGASLRINVRTEGGERLRKGDEAVVTDFNRDENVYIISKLEV